MVRSVTIASRSIGEGSPCFIIAEAGSNHNGNLSQAKRLIEVAAWAGADAVKFQLFRASKLYPKQAGRSDYLKQNRSIYEIIAEMEMPYEWLPELAATCQQKGILFLASVFDEESVDRLDPHVLAYKVASYEMTHLPLVRHIAQKGKPVIIATGTSHLEEVRETVETFRGTGNPNLILMQCTAAYPAPLESLNVRAITTMKELFQVPVGLSDHSRDPLVGPLAAVAVGANLIEKHFTLSNRLPGPDHGFAVEPAELKLLVEKVRGIEKALGDGKKVMQPIEEELYRFARRVLFACQPIPKGQEITAEKVAILRKGKKAPGLPPGLLQEVVGKRAARDIHAEEPIREEDVVWDDSR